MFAGQFARDVVGEHMSTIAQERRPRYSRSLPQTTSLFRIEADWDLIPPVPPDKSDRSFLDVLEKHGFGALEPLVPLQGRYTRGRRWTEQEFESCFEAWRSGISLTRIAANLNRNPQDMIYRLLDRCHELGIDFTEQGRSEGSLCWTEEVAACASELFEKGLPAWKIATLFKVDFEHVEKQMFTKRSDYGHNKKNPFAINTTHKYFVNKQVLERSGPVHRALDAFAGEGKGTSIITTCYPHADILAIEKELATFSVATSASWSPSVQWVNEDNMDTLGRLTTEGQQFDLIDLDPFVTCHEQIPLVWKLAKERSLLFLTFGGEYRRSFISGNRKAIANRYDFADVESNNSDYLEKVPFMFLGWVAKQAAQNGFRFDVIRAVRYANNCRFWLDLSAVHDSSAWLADTTRPHCGGTEFMNADLPRFAQVRQELTQCEQMSLFD